MDRSHFVSDCSVYYYQASAQGQLQEFIHRVVNIFHALWPIAKEPVNTYDERLKCSEKAIERTLSWCADVRREMEPQINWRTAFNLYPSQWETEAKPFRILFDIQQRQRTAKFHRVGAPLGVGGTLVNAGRKMPELVQDLHAAREAAHVMREERKRELAEQRKDRLRRKQPPSPPGLAATRISKRKRTSKADRLPQRTKVITSDGEELDIDTDTSTEFIRPYKPSRESRSGPAVGEGSSSKTEVARIDGVEREVIVISD
ncbi:hypothetical protein BKA70DRAFT_1431871 [Coprinopsis sp. MPI-PUGE-AT-0042]|nr:hypothetical protein BKA70DRAFT_1431871 [Coprinopsis sp. MPI-PUGE-AT-0042]